ncbi:MAG: ABC transporter ATP-binding protein [Lachnospiraceae bacterium]
MILEVDKVSKKIRGKVILSDINLRMESGHIYGFVGRNGCGKTMLFRAVSGLMKIDKGRVILDNKVLGIDMTVLPNAGIVLENAGLYQEFTGFKNLKILSKLKSKISDNDIKKAIERVGLNPEDKRSYRKYSLGMKQRIVIAQSIMEKPDVLFLDEPTNALDAEGVEEIRKVIIEEKERGAIVLIASHNKEDIEILADKVYHMDNGKIISVEEH